MSNTEKRGTKTLTRKWCNTNKKVSEKELTVKILNKENKDESKSQR